MENTIKSPSPPRTCTTVRRNPPRNARPTPSTTVGTGPHFYSSNRRNMRDVAPFRLQEILDEDVPQISPTAEAVAPPKPPEEDEISENLKVFLRIRPLDISKPTSKNGNNAIRHKIKGLPQKKETVAKNDNVKMKKKETCLVVKDSQSVTLSPPASLQDSKRTKTVVYDGFSHVFAPDSLQEEVYEKVMEALVSDFLRGKSGLLAAMGPSGSGKTHTVFGCPREPGIVPLTLRRLFEQKERNSSEELSRSYFISVFEIYSERGKGEKIFDLTSDGADLSLQHSAIKGFQEIMVSDVQEAECIIARAMLKRATALTNTNSQSSRSQCIINIHTFLKKINDGEAAVQEKNAVLTIVDLAGAERERRTGNQGARLLESNFINNTSMVFGLCLRSLLEHQKNPKKPLQKHFQNSLLTRYLRDYLEGKRRMTLILTAKPGEDDYLDTSYLLRQASPYMKIKFNDAEEEPSHLLGQKRHVQALSKIEQPKRKKIRDRVASVIDEREGAGDAQSILQKEVILGNLQEPELLKVSGSSTRPLKIQCNEYNLLKEEYRIELGKRDRNDHIMRSFSKALWDVLKQYKKKLEASESEVHNLKESLEKEKFRNSELEKELKDMKPCHLWCRKNSTEASMLKLCIDTDFDTTGCLQLEQHESNNINEVHAEICAPKPEVLECINISNLCDVVVSPLQCLNPKSNSTPEKEKTGEYLEERENLEVKDSCSDADVTGLSDSGSMVGSSQSQALVVNDDTSPIKQKELFSKGEKIPKAEVKHSSNRPSDWEKPRRRLGPPPSLLLKDVSNLDLQDDDKRKGSRGGKKSTAGERAMTQGSISLLKLLGNYRHL